MSFFQRYRYESVAAIDGVVIMTLEMVGARMIAPYFGSTIFVWTAVIGVILGALSFGYWYGGRLADREATDEKLVKIMTLGAGVLLISLLMAPLSLKIASDLAVDLRLRALVAAILMFGFFNILAGIVSPYLAKLRMTTLSTAGSSVGRLYAAGTAGSILGTFLTGYWLIGWMGSRTLAFSLVLLLLGSSLILSRRAWWAQRTVIAIMTVAVMAVPNLAVTALLGSKLVYDGDSSYMRYLVLERNQNGRPVRLLATDNFADESGIYTDNINEPVFDYTKRFMEIAAANSEARRVLVIGGGTYTVPRMLANTYPGMMIDVAEIDPKLDQLAQKYFGFVPSSRINIVHADGRTFLNSNKQKYDLIYVDAFSSLTPPFALTTAQAVTELASSTAPGGVVAVNLVSSVNGPMSPFLRAENSTYRSVFRYANITPAQLNMNEKSISNLILVVSNDEASVRRASAGMKTPPLQAQVSAGMILTDDFAPVEQLLGYRNF